MEPHREIISTTQGKVFSDGVFLETSLLLVLGFRPRESRALLLVVNVMTILRITSIFSSAVNMSKTRGKLLGYGV